MHKSAPDLTRQPPRSPREELCGVVHLARMLDKARAFEAETLGEYIYPCPMDRMLLEFLKLDAVLLRQAAATRTDAQVAEWVAMHGAKYSAAEKDAFNQCLLAHAPDTPEAREHFMAQREALRPGRDDVTTWAALIDLDEGRL
ncbi:MAG: DUF5069 domain-containing protein [Nitrospirota bacterium]|nr:DUF5069 domain-containing protein [Nitrospirota bacterium]